MIATKLPTLLNEEQALSLIESVIEKSVAEGVFISIDASESALSRFSENQISQNLNKTRFQLTITSYFGKRSASASTTEMDPEAITDTLKRSEILARFAPEDPEWVPLLAPQIYPDAKAAFDQATASLSPLVRGEMVQEVCSLSRNAGVNGSGTLSTAANIQAIGNSVGVRAYNQITEADFSFTAKQDNGSGWSNKTAWNIGDLLLPEMTEEAIARALASRNPKEVQPGTYPVVFSAPAFASLLSWVVWSLDARAADEGRSFMSKENGNKVGEQLFSPILQVQRDRAHPLLQLGTFFGDGLSNNYLEIIKDGIPQTLSYSRYWAQQQGKQPTGSMYPIVMTGSDRSLTDLIAQTERGILVNRLWYLGYVNPRTLEVTGMTRDGTFWIENGKIAYPIKNLRFNQNLPEMLRDVEAVSQVQRCRSSVVPGVKVRAFNFSSVTDSV